MIQRCPVDPDQSAEAYLMGRLSTVKDAAFMNHCAGCPQCNELAASRLDLERYSHGGGQLRAPRARGQHSEISFHLGVRKPDPGDASAADEQRGDRRAGANARART